MNQLLVTRFLIVVLFFLQSSNISQVMAQKSRDDVAKTFLEMLPKELTKDNAEILGFKSLAELENLSLGTPIQEFMVRLDHLQDYTSDMDPNRLLIDTKTYIYPVNVYGKLQMSLEISMVEDNWEVTAFGAPNYIEIIENERASLTKRTSFKIQEFSLVKIPSINLYFLRYSNKRDILLVPLFDYPQLEIRRGSDAKAEEVFMKLSSWAKSHDGNPG